LYVGYLILLFKNVPESILLATTILKLALFYWDFKGTIKNCSSGYHIISVDIIYLYTSRCLLHKNLRLIYTVGITVRILDVLDTAALKVYDCLSWASFCSSGCLLYNLTNQP
jgi:hypothetical protein